MGVGSGGGYAESPSSGAVFRGNVSALSKKFPLDEHGRFGAPGRRLGVQVVTSGSPGATAREFFNTLGRDGQHSPLANGGGTASLFDDDSIVVFRPSSKSGGPVIEITAGGKASDRYKIHFELKEPTK